MKGKFEAKKELEKLKGIVEQLPEDKKKLTEGLVADAAFMAEQLEILRSYIQQNGWSEEYQNGANQRGKKTSVEAQAYAQIQKSYASVIRQLTDMLPTNVENKPGADLMKFIGAE